VPENPILDGFSVLFSFLNPLNMSVLIIDACRHDCQPGNFLGTHQDRGSRSICRSKNDYDILGAFHRFLFNHVEICSDELDDGCILFSIAHPNDKYSVSLQVCRVAIHHCFDFANWDIENGFPEQDDIIRLFRAEILDGSASKFGFFLPAIVPGSFDGFLNGDFGEIGSGIACKFSLIQLVGSIAGAAAHIENGAVAYVFLQDWVNWIFGCSLEVIPLTAAEFLIPQ